MSLKIFIIIIIMFEVGIWKYEVVAKGEVDVLKFEVGIRKDFDV